MAKPLKLAVVGAGSIGIRGALDHLVLPDVQDRVVMTAVCDPAPGRAKAAAEKYRVPQAFETLDELLAKGDVDAVTLGSPIGIHFEQGLACIRAGKHVHFNKTMTTTTAEADQLIAEAQARNVKLVASPGEMLRPHNRCIRDLLRDGALGQLAWAVIGCAFGTYHEKEGCRQGNDALSNINPAWYWQKSAGGGPLYDMTVYGLHALTGILGPARRATAFSGVAVKEREFRGRRFASDCHDNTVILLDFGGTLFAFAHGTFAGTITRFANPNFYGSKGSIVGLDMNGKPIAYPGREEADKAKTGYQVLLPHVKNTPHREMEEAHVFEDIMQLVDLAREGTPTASSPEHARHVIEIIEAAYRAAETGQTQTLRTTFAGV